METIPALLAVGAVPSPDSPLTNQGQQVDTSDVKIDAKIQSASSINNQIVERKRAQTSSSSSVLLSSPLHSSPSCCSAASAASAAASAASAAASATTAAYILSVKIQSLTGESVQNFTLNGTHTITDIRALFQEGNIPSYDGEVWLQRGKSQSDATTIEELSGLEYVNEDYQCIFRGKRVGMMLPTMLFVSICEGGRKKGSKMTRDKKKKKKKIEQKRKKEAHRRKDTDASKSYADTTPMKHTHLYDLSDTKTISVRNRQLDDDNHTGDNRNNNSNKCSDNMDNNVQDDDSDTANDSVNNDKHYKDDDHDDNKDSDHDTSDVKSTTATARPHTKKSFFEMSTDDIKARLSMVNARLGMQDLRASLAQSTLVVSASSAPPLAGSSAGFVAGTQRLNRFHANFSRATDGTDRQKKEGTGAQSRNNNNSNSSSINDSSDDNDNGHCSHNTNVNRFNQFLARGSERTSTSDKKTQINSNSGSSALLAALDLGFKADSKSHSE